MCASTSDPKKQEVPKWNPRPVDTSFKTFLWNSDTKQFMGRTGSSWAKIGLFYVIFYAFLAGFFAVLFAAFYQTIDENKPTYVGKESILKNPGLGFRPYFKNFENKMHQLDYYYDDYYVAPYFAQDIEELLDQYENQPDSEFRDCETEPEGEGHCKVDIAKLKEVCPPDHYWGYEGKNPSPVFLLKLNKMIGFIPQPIKNVTKLPADLQEYIRNKSLSVQDQVFVWCKTDVGSVKLAHYPRLPLYYYPYTYSKTYLPPLACVRVSNLPLGQAVKLTCKVWADNVKESKDGRSTGRAVFNIKVDSLKEKAAKEIAESTT